MRSGRPSAIETIEGIRRVKAEIPGVKTSLGVLQRVVRSGPARPRVINSVFLHHCVEAGSIWRWSTPTTSRPTGRSRGRARAGRRIWCSSSRDGAGARDRALRGQGWRRRGRRRGRRRSHEEMEPERRCTSTSCAGRKDGVEEWIDRSVREDRRGTDLNDRAAAGHEGGGATSSRRRADPAFVLQSAEVMKRAVAQPGEVPGQARGLHQGHRGDRHRVRRRARHRQVAGQHDPHQHGYTVIDLGKQVPILHDSGRRRGAQGHGDRPERAARLDFQADARLRTGSSTSRELDFPCWWVARRSTATSGCGSSSTRHRDRRRLRTRSLLLQGRVRGPGPDGPADRP